MTASTVSCCCCCIIIVNHWNWSKIWLSSCIGLYDIDCYVDADFCRIAWSRKFQGSRQRQVKYMICLVTCKLPSVMSKLLCRICGAFTIDEQFDSYVAWWLWYAIQFLIKGNITQRFILQITMVPSLWQGHPWWLQGPNILASNIISLMSTAKREIYSWKKSKQQNNKPITLRLA